MNQHDSIYGLVGKSLVHSFSQKYFRDQFKQKSIDADYLNFELSSISDFLELKQNFPNLRGVNVTIPYKEAIIPFLDEIHGDATKINAVNTVTFRDGRTHGYNTDAIGFAKAVKHKFPQLEINKALVLGTGGAAKAISFALSSKLNCSAVSLVSRSKKEPDILTYNELPDVISTFDVIINATPLGTFPNVDQKPRIPYRNLQPAQAIIDLVYNPPETVFLKAAADMGCKVMNGHNMLIFQAEASWDIWQSPH